MPCQGWGEALAETQPGRWQMADQGCLGSLSLPLLLATCLLGPSPPSNPISCSLTRPWGPLPSSHSHLPEETAKAGD